MCIHDNLYLPPKTHDMCEFLVLKPQGNWSYLRYNFAEWADIFDEK